MPRDTKLGKKVAKIAQGGGGAKTAQGGAKIFCALRAQKFCASRTLSIVVPKF